MKKISRLFIFFLILKSATAQYLLIPMDWQLMKGLAGLEICVLNFSTVKVKR